MRAHRFGPASPEEQVVFGANRPGYPAGPGAGAEKVEEWVSFMKGQGIVRVCCLLTEGQFAYYACDLLNAYRQSFGVGNVIHVEVEDFHLCERERLIGEIMPFLKESDALERPVVVHCSGGSGRTGHVLAAWLVGGRGYGVVEALGAVWEMGRNPWEALEHRHASQEDLRLLLEACR
jgi:protein-tyrosine phosphatase